MRGVGFLDVHIIRLPIHPNQPPYFRFCLLSYVTVQNVTYTNLSVPDLRLLCYIYSMRPGWTKVAHIPHWREHLFCFDSEYFVSVMRLGVNQPSVI